MAAKSATLTRSAILPRLGVPAKVDRVWPLRGDQELGVPTRIQHQPRRLEEKGEARSSPRRPGGADHGNFPAGGHRGWAGEARSPAESR